MQIPAHANNLCRGLTRLKHLTQNSSGEVLLCRAHKSRGDEIKSLTRKKPERPDVDTWGGGGEEPNNFETVEEKWIHVGH